MNFKFLFTAAIILFISGINFGQTKKINVKSSNIEWIGKKVSGKHNGDIKFKSGSLKFKKSILTGGTFVIDMKTINTTDLEGEMKQKLDGHLKADVFFGVTKFPTATLTFTSVKALKGGKYTVKADLTIKGIKKPVTFELSTAAKSATATFNIDRTLYDIKYGSGSFFDDLGDKAINNEFEVTTKINF